MGGLRGHHRVRPHRLRALEGHPQQRPRLPHGRLPEAQLQQLVRPPGVAPAAHREARIRPAGAHGHARSRRDRPRRGAGRGRPRRLAGPARHRGRRKAEIARACARSSSCIDQIGLDTKAQVLIKRLEAFEADGPDPKVLIFTQSRDTQEYLAQEIPAPWTVHIFHGQLDPREKDDAVTAFREGKGPRILISTEAGGEGRNFQFCHNLVNYDLPWNPMKIEQRIGRLDRIGQKHPVKIFNFSMLGTIEERVLDVLTNRIRVFEETIGGLDPILGEVENDIGKVFLMADAEGKKALRDARHAAGRPACARPAPSRSAWPTSSWTPSPTARTRWSASWAPAAPSTATCCAASP